MASAPLDARTLFLAALACGVILGLFAGLGLVFVVLALGLLLTVLIVQWPKLGLTLVIISSLISVIGAIRAPGLPFLGPTQAFILLTLFSWFLWMGRYKIGLTYAPHMIPLLGYLVIVVLSIGLTAAPLSDTLIGYQKHIMLVLPYFLIANLAVTGRSVRYFAGVVTGTIAVSGLIGVAEFFLPAVDLIFEIQLGARTEVLSMGIGPIKRVTGGMGDFNWFGYSNATVLALSIFWFRIARTNSSRLYASIFVLLNLAGVVLSYTRTAIAGVLVAVAYLTWKRRLPVVAVILGGLLMAVSLPLWAPSGFVDRVFSPKYFRGGSTSMRIEIVTVAADLIKEKPIFGYGYQQFGPLFMERAKTPENRELARRAWAGEEPAHLMRAHNLYLDVAVAYGLVGLIPLVAMFILLLIEMAQVARYGKRWQRELAIALSACFVTYFALGMGGHHQELKVFWVLAGLAAALRRVTFEGDREDGLVENVPDEGQIQANKTKVNKSIAG